MELVFESTQSGPLTINCLFGGWGQAKGTAWYDDLSLQEVKPIYAQADGQKEIKGLADRGRRSSTNTPSPPASAATRSATRVASSARRSTASPAARIGAYLYESLVDPTATLAEGFDKLGASPMPPMNLLLNDQQLADVMAYLMTLKENRIQPTAQPNQEEPALRRLFLFQPLDAPDGSWDTRS